MSAIIHFIGLVTLVTTTSITPEPPHILIPRFSDIIKKENNVIVIPDALVDKSATTWPFTQSAEGDMFEIKTRNIRISGTGSFTNAVTAIPHLTCCCNPMKGGLKSDYNDPEHDPLNKKSAYVFLDHGTLTAPEDPETKARHLQLSVPSADGKITITGQEKNKPAETIVINLAATGDTQITFSNLPDDDDHDAHWAHYYRMSSNPNLCTENPKKDPVSCGPKVQPDGCLNTTSAKKSVAAKKPAKTAKAAHAHSQVSSCKTCMVVDINCSGSQWP